MNTQRTIKTKYAIIMVAVIATFSAASVVRSAVSTFADGIVIGDTQLTSGLLLDVNGKIGATEICDSDHSNCVTTSELYGAIDVAGGGVAGSGSNNYIAKFTGTETVGGSQIIDNGTNVGIGVANPLQKLHVDGDFALNGSWIELGSQSIHLSGSYGAGFDYNYTSNHVDIAEIQLRDAQNTRYGSIYGKGSGSIFGLLDGNHRWSFLSIKDANIQLRINDDTKLTINNDDTIVTKGKLGIGKDPTVALDVEGYAVIDEGLKIGNTGAGCNSATTGTLRVSGSLLYFCNGSAWKQVN